MQYESNMLDWMRVLQLGDSTFPTGAFAFSHGLESAIECKLVHDVKTLRSYVQTAVEQAAGGDGVALLCAYRAAAEGDLSGVCEADRYVLTRKLNEETRSMTTRTGKKLIEVAERVLAPTHDVSMLKLLRERIIVGTTAGSYPVCLSLIFASLKLPIEGCFMVHQYGVAMSILSAAVRLMKVDHVDVQTILFEVNSQIEVMFKTAWAKKLEDMSNFAPTVDVLAAVHVTAHVRMFMS